MTEILYRQSVYAFILNPENKVLLVHKRNSNRWDFPGGGIDEGESLEEAVKREIHEELSLTDVQILHKGSFINKYDWPETEREKHFKKTGLWRSGQEQHFYILKFNGDNNAVKIQEEELTEFKWVPLYEVKAYMSYENQYESIQKVFSEYGMTIES